MTTKPHPADLYAQAGRECVFFYGAGTDNSMPCLRPAREHTGEMHQFVPPTPPERRTRYRDLMREHGHLVDKAHCDAHERHNISCLRCVDLEMAAHGKIRCDHMGCTGHGDF